MHHRAVMDLFAYADQAAPSVPPFPSLPAGPGTDLFPHSRHHLRASIRAHDPAWLTGALAGAREDYRTGRRGVRAAILAGMIRAALANQ